jgi:hypothetical protein
MFVHAQGRNCIIEVAYSSDGRVFYKEERNSRYYAVDEHGPEVGAPSAHIGSAPRRLLVGLSSDTSTDTWNRFLDLTAR